MTGRTPFTGTPIDLLHQHRFAQFDRPSRIEPSLHPDFEAIICSLLEKDPADRPADAGVLYRQLDSLKRKVARQEQNAVAETVRVLSGGPGGRRAGDADEPADALELGGRPGPIARVLHPRSSWWCCSSCASARWPGLLAEQPGVHVPAAATMASDDPADWERVGPLPRTAGQKFPDHPYQAEVEAFRQRIEAAA
ncbi:MAG: hypothetical protein U0736_01970 [Gemmataceae bacterium]